MLKSIIYIAPAEIIRLVSQVYPLLKEFKKRQFFDRIILLAGVKNNQNWSHELSKLLQSGLEVILFSQYPNYSFFNNKQKNELISVLKRILTGNTIIHLRSESLTGIIRATINKLQYENVKILTDVRGAIYEETRFYNRYKPIQYQLKLHQHRIKMKSLGQCSDRISCVSEKLRQYILDRTIIDKNKVYVNHCIAGDIFTFSKKSRETYRKKLGLFEKDIIFVFISGSNANWQNTEQIIKNITDQNYKLLNLSKSKINLKNVINLFVPYEEVPNYLCAADIGIIWRNNDIVNNVASPIKFSEYVCCGLPIIANDGVCMIKDYIIETGYGKIIKKFDEIDVNMLSDLLNIQRKTISKNAKRKFSSITMAQNYDKIYNNMLFGD